MKLTLGFSPCPNDTFIFDAMVHGKIDTGGLTFDPVIEDVETLNQMALRKEHDITKISFHAFGFVQNQYLLLNSGSALGNNCGPILISHRHLEMEDFETSNLKIAIPGKLTTANLLLSLALPNADKKQEMLFSEIEDTVLSGNTDAGLIIHENRFTYRQKGLKKVIDLGEWWENLTNCPIPLGGIVARKSLSPEVLKKIDGIMRRSVEYALKHRETISEFVKANAMEMDEEVIKKHIDLYVNKFTIDLGSRGREAVNKLLGCFSHDSTLST